MGLRIRTNVSSLNAQRHLSKSTRMVGESMSKLSSGHRINKSSDDAAGLAVSDNLTADIRSLDVAKRNAADGISMVQTAEGGFVETGNMLVRLRELAVQASSDTIGNTEREFLDKEFLQLKDEIDRIASATEFNGTRLLVGGGDLSEEIMSETNRNPLEIQVGKDYFPGADAKGERNPVNIIKIDFTKLNGLTYGEGSLDLGKDVEGTRVHRKDVAQQSMVRIDKALQQVNNYRAYLGSVQNRLFSTVSNLEVQVQNLSESKSRIRDVDFATETAELTKQNILQQSGVAMLSNANSQPKIALSLLQQ